MKSNRVLSVFALAALLLSMLSFPAAARPTTSQVEGLDKVEALVLEELAANGQTDFLVWMAEKADLSPAAQLPTKAEKGQFVYETLRATAERTQAELRSFLDAQGATYRPFYIANKIWIQGGTQALLEAVAGRPEVAKITANHEFQLDAPFPGSAPEQRTESVEPNITFINADDVWAMGITGQGTVMAGNDTGLDETHPAIAPHYRGCLNPPACTEWDHNYNWWDAWGWSPNDPADDYGHGTHTTGTMVGDDGGANQIGVAPGAQTIHCKNMSGGGGDDAHFIVCFEWDLAPWDLNGQNPLPEMAPDAINNSWGYWYGNNPTFEDEIAALQAAGIAVEVSAGNEGPGCYSLRSPGDYSQVLTTGSVNHAGGVLPGTITGFSSRGPSYLHPEDTAIPDIMAPGENIRSSVPGNGYEYWGGTSMAGPHATALIGLIWSANPALRGQIDTTYQIIYDTAVRLVGQPGSGCGGDYVNGPNNDWGYGAIDAYQAVLLAIAMGGAGTLQGTVTDDVTSLPVEGATVHAVHNEGFAWSDVTDASGFYQMTVAAGTFEVTASHPHYQPETVTGVVVEEDGTTVQDFALTPRGWAYGYVYDYDNGTPIEGASVTAEDGSTTDTDASGYYELWLDPGTHTLTAAAQDYAPESAEVMIYSGQGTQQDFSLQAAVVFIPSPIEVSVPLGSTHTEPATILNRQPWDYPFEFQEKDEGYIPLLGEPVTVQVPAGPAAAPDGTAVAAGAYQARPAGTVAIQPGGGINQANVLLLNADDDNGGYSPIRDMLLAYGDLGLVDLFDARYATPTLDQLLAYNVVVVWANYVFADAYGMGDVLADYVDAGGKVIDLMFALDPSWGYQGRFRNEGYSAMTVAGASYVTSCLGSYDPDHPIMDGVTDVCDLYRGYATALTAGSYEVARWQDNELFVAVKDDGSVATLNGYVGVYYQWTGQFADVLHNAINFLAVPADVPWLAEDPVAGVVPADSSLDVDILFDASPAAGVTQPGTYMAELTVKGDPKVKVPVVMTVEAPSNYGRLDGTVIGLGYCDQNPVPLEEAEVVITGSSGASVTLLTDEFGYYATWLDEADSPYTIAVTYPEYLPGLATGVIIVGGQNTTVDFDLRWDGPCLDLTPLSLETTLNMGETDTQQVTLTNVGAGEGTFEVSDLEKDYVPMRKGFLPAAERPSVPDTTPTSIGPAPNAPTASPEEIGKALGVLTGEPAYAVDIYPGYNLVYFYNDNPSDWSVIAPLPGNQYFAGDFINGDFSTLYVIDYATNSLYTVDTATGAVTLIGPSTPYGGESWTGMTGSVDGTMYASSTNISRSTLYTVDLDTGAVTVVGEITNCPAIIDIAITPEGEIYGVDIVNDNLIRVDPATGEGTVVGYIGFNANYAQGSDYEEESGTLYLAAYSSQGELRIADPATGNTVLVEAFPGGAEVDSMGFATGGGADAPWLYEDPVSGTVPPDTGQQVIDVTFDAGMVTQPGTYTGEVRVKTNDPVNKTFVVNATMVVIGPPDWGRVEGIVQSLGHCDSNPVPAEGALVTIDGSLVLETDENGFYSTWLPSGMHELVVTADGHVSASATVEVFPQQTTYQDFGLRSIEPCISVTPSSFEVTVMQGMNLEETLTIVNAGAGASTFEIQERTPGFGEASVPAGATTAQAPEGYAPTAVSPSPKGRILDGTVAIFKDANPWGSMATETFLAMNGIPYEVHTSAEFGTLDFTNYGMIVFSGDQPQSFYDAYGSYVWKFEDYVDQGGFLNFFSCDAGWNGGTLTAPLPGNMTWTGWIYENYNDIDDPAHPVVQGVPNPFYGNYASHGHFTNLPAEGHIIASEQMGGLPTIVEYPIGAGWFIAFGQPLEISYDWGWDAGIIFGNTLLWGYSYVPQLDIPWLVEDPVEGTVDADSSVDIAVTFVVTPGMPIGDYYANLKVKTEDAVNPSIIVPVTLHVVAPGMTMHVNAIEGNFVIDYMGRPILRMRVQAVDQAAMPLQDVLVDASIWVPDGGPFERSRYTKPSGWARFHWGSLASGTWTICVDNLTLAGYTYNPDDNVVTCMDWYY